MYKHVPVNLNEQTPFFFQDWFYKQALEECAYTHHFKLRLPYFKTWLGWDHLLGPDM